MDVKDDAFLALSTSKDTVFMGEGFTATLAFYVSEKNQAPLQFYDLGNSLLIFSRILNLPMPGKKIIILKISTGRL